MTVEATAFHCFNRLRVVTDVTSHRRLKMSLLHTLFRRTVPVQPQQRATVGGPVALQPNQLKAVVGAGPNGTWLARTTSTAGPNGTWY